LWNESSWLILYFVEISEQWENDQSEPIMTDPGSRPRILLADDHAGMRASAAKLVGSEFEVVAAVADGFLALEAVARLCPELVVLDIAMPGLDGIHTARALRRNGNQVKIVFLTVQEDEDYVSAALDAGALGYVLKSRMQSDLIPAIRQALAGEVFISRRNHTPE